EQVPEMLMLDASEKTELMMQYMSNSKTNRYINSEINDLSLDFLHGSPAFTYVRYNVELEPSNMYRKYHPDKNPNIIKALSKFTEKEVQALRSMDNGKNTEKLLELGDIFANEEVKYEHFPTSFATNSASKISM
ncbi:MAG: hypothetical protein R3E95_15245, partial [Thiolinea sp.]